MAQDVSRLNRALAKQEEVSRDISKLKETIANDKKKLQKAHEAESEMLSYMDSMNN